MGLPAFTNLGLPNPWSHPFGRTVPSHRSVYLGWLRSPNIQSEENIYSAWKKNWIIWPPQGGFCFCFWNCCCLFVFLVKLFFFHVAFWQTIWASGILWGNNVWLVFMLELPFFKDLLDDPLFLRKVLILNMEGDLCLTWSFLNKNGPSNLLFAKPPFDQAWNPPVEFVCRCRFAQMIYTPEN